LIEFFILNIYSFQSAVHLSDTYVLVHGAWHTGELLEPVAQAIRAHGHMVIWRDAFINDADAALAQSAYDKLNPQPYKTFTEAVQLNTALAEMMIGKSYLNFQQDAAMPLSMPWHPRLSERLGLFRLVEGQGNHEVCFTNPTLLADKIIEAGRD
jgi:hypothetical protein